MVLKVCVSRKGLQPGGGVCPRGDGEGNEVAEGHGRQRPAHGFGKRAGWVAAVPTEGRRTFGEKKKTEAGRGGVGGAS